VRANARGVFRSDFFIFCGDCWRAIAIGVIAELALRWLI
jgi:hypothetical protein